MSRKRTLRLRDAILGFSGFLLSACNGYQPHLHLGTDDGFHQQAGASATAISFGLGGEGSALPDGLFGGTSEGPNTQTTSTPVNLKRTRSIGLSLSQSHPVAPRVTIEPQIYAGIGQARYALPDGVLLANERTRLTDPIKADFISLRVEPQVSVFVALGPAHKPWGKQGIGAGIAVAHVKSSITSALINAHGSTRVTDPFVSATTQVGGAVLELRRYRDFGTTGKIEWRLPL